MTACHRCNSYRKDRSVQSFAKDVAGYVGNTRTTAEILAHIRKTTKKTIDVAAAKLVIAERGWFVGGSR